MSAPSTTPLLFHSPSIGNTYGALLLGTFLGLILYGVALYQTYRYLRRPNLTDSVYIRCFVYFIIIFDTVYTAMSMHMSYWYLVTNFFRPFRLFTGVWSIDLLPISTGVGICACQARRYRPLVILTGIMFFVVLGFASMATVKAFVLPNLEDFAQIAWANSAAFGTIVAADLMLTMVLIRVLHRSRTGFRRTDSIIDVLIAYTITTGLVTDVVGLVCLIMALVRPGDLIYAACDMICTKLYVNCVLATLNSRPGEESSLPTEDDPRRRAMYLESLSCSETTVSLAEAPPPLPVASGNGRWDTEVLHIKPTEESYNPCASPV